MSISSKVPAPVAGPTVSPAGRLPFYYGWVNVGVAFVAMVATLPGRTWGLGLITEPLLRDLELDHDTYAQLNLWATLLGSLACFPAGWLIDRVGSRLVGTLLGLSLGAVVMAMSRVQDLPSLYVLVTLTRALGQVALTLVSLTLIGKWFKLRLSQAMGVFMFLTIFGFMVAERSLDYAVVQLGWRPAWYGVGLVLAAGFAPLTLLLARSTPEGCGLPVDGWALGPVGPGGAELDYGWFRAAREQEQGITAPERFSANPARQQRKEDLSAPVSQVDNAASLTFPQSLATPIYWLAALGVAVNALTQAGISLFGESLVEQRGMDRQTYVYLLIVSTFGALPGNVLAGWLGRKGSVQAWMALGMGLLLLSLIGLPLVQTETQVYAVAALWGLSCGINSVVFLAVWGQAFGRTHLGKIQGSSQVLQVLGSAFGPLLMVRCQALTGSYTYFFWASAAVCGILALLSLLVRLPSTRQRSSTP